MNEIDELRVGQSASGDRTAIKKILVVKGIREAAGADRFLSPLGKP